MMKQLIFTIYDEKAEQHLPPFTLPQEGIAKRTFNDCIHDENHAFCRNPSDYTLFKIGEFDTNTGHVKPLEAKKSLGNGAEYKNKPNAGEVEALARQEIHDQNNPLREHMERKSNCGD